MKSSPTCLAVLCLFVVGFGACGLEERDGTTSCCHYICEGPRSFSFAQNFGSEGECVELATFRCSLGENEGVGVYEFQPVTLGTEEGDPDLDDLCESGFAEFLTRSSTTAP